MRRGTRGGNRGRRHGARDDAWGDVPDQPERNAYYATPVGVSTRPLERQYAPARPERCVHCGGVLGRGFGRLAQDVTYPESGHRAHLACVSEPDFHVMDAVLLERLGAR